MKWTLTFQRPSQVPSMTPSIIWLFPFNLVDSSLIGLPEEVSRTSPHQVVVKVDRILATAMGFYHLTYFDDDEMVKRDHHSLMKVLFEYGKRHVIRKLREEGALALKEEWVCDTANTMTPCEFDPARIDDPTDARYELDTDPPRNQPSVINITANRDINIGGDIVKGNKTTGV